MRRCRLVVLRFRRHRDGKLHLLAQLRQDSHEPVQSEPGQVRVADAGKIGMADAGRRLGLPISVHASGSRPAIGQVATIAKAGLLASDMQIIHANFATAEEIDAMAKAGAAVSLSPFSELRIGFGVQHTGKFLAAGIPVGLSVDTDFRRKRADRVEWQKLTLIHN